MPRVQRSDPAQASPLSPQLLNPLLESGEGAPSIEDKVARTQSLRSDLPGGGVDLDRFFLRAIERQGSGLREAQQHLESLREVVSKLAAPPWHPATFVRRIDTPLGVRAMVAWDGSRRILDVAPEVDLAALAAGDEVLLNQEQSAVLAASPEGAAQPGELAFFERRLADGRLVVRWRDDEMVVDPAARVLGAELQSGDVLRWDRRAGMALEKLERSADNRFLVDQIPDAHREMIGGQDANLEALISALTLAIADPALAARYRIGKRRSVLLVGPPGGGKTLLARIAAAEIARLTGKACRFAVVKPAEWESPFVGSTQQNIAACFRALCEAARDGYAVLFLDEVEAAGRMRGHALENHSDKFLAALLAELDGFVDRSGVAIVAATNRKDLIDPALLERLSDLELAVRRPDRSGARAIFDIHLPAALPFAPLDGQSGDPRRAMIDAAVARLYGPNGDNELCVLRLRDGTSRTVAARDLASGRLFAQICDRARQAACLREVRQGEPGIRAIDLDEAVSEALERLASTLSPRNAHAHLDDLPQDLDVVAVEPIARRVPRPHRYLNAA